MLFNYNVVNASGMKIGVMSLESEDLPKLLMAGEKLLLGGEWTEVPEQKFRAFMVVPEPVEANSD